jgi:hypothetical protein
MKEFLVDLILFHALDKDLTLKASGWMIRTNMKDTYWLGYQAFTGSSFVE